MRSKVLVVLLGLGALAACAQAEPVTDGAGGAAGSDASSGGGSGGSDGGGSGGSGAADAGDGEADASVPEPCRCGEPSCGPCPTTKNVAAGGYGINATEVTNEEYATWLLWQPNPKLQTGACAWNTSYLPSQGWPATYPKLPVVYVDFCDAVAYCRWSGRRLCGKIGGGANGFADFADASKSQWYNACSVGGTRPYPYGATYAGGSCNGADYGKGGPVAVGEATACEGGYPSLQDMSGNVWEWEDSCSGSAGEADLCRIRGGSYSQSGAALACDADSSLTRNTTGKSVGFRCCE